jgi:hypothetical protein
VAHSISPSALNMAEQTITAMFNSYHTFAKRLPVNDDAFHARLAYFNHFSAIDAANRETRSKTGWSYSAPFGCNISSPLFDGHNNIAIHCYSQRFPVPGKRSKTVFRLAAMLRRSRLSTGHNWAFQTKIRYAASDGRFSEFPFHVNAPVVQHFQIPSPARIYLVFEIMDDGQPHDVPYAGCPNLGPFKDFGAASRLGIHVEWFNTASGSWIQFPVQKCAPRRPFLKSVQNSDMMGAIKNWRRAMEIMQLLEGIDYQGDTHGLTKSLYLLRKSVQVFTVDHLDQSVKWVPLPRQSRPAPAVASFEYNAQLMRNQWNNTWTQVNLKEKPPNDSDFWVFNSLDARVRASMSTPKCDLCLYTSTNAIDLGCERDPQYPDQFVCKCCSLLNRPCTFTPRSKALVLWGSGSPFLITETARLARYPTGPHRLLSFHQTLTPEQQIQAQPADTPIEGPDGLEMVGDMEVVDTEEGEAAVGDDDEDLEDDDG